MITNEEAEQFDRDLEKLRRQGMKRIPNVIFKMRLLISRISFLLQCNGNYYSNLDNNTAYGGV